MSKNLSLLIKIIFVLILFTIILPYFVDSIINMFVEDQPPNSKGNSTFVSSPSIVNLKSFKQNFYNLTKCYLY